MFDCSTQVNEIEVIEFLQKNLLNNHTGIVTKEYILMALVKLSTRFKESTK